MKTKENNHSKFQFNRKDNKDFYIWGKRPLEAFLTDLSHSKGEVETDLYKLHLITDKEGKVPSQLRTIVELCKSYNFKIRLHEDLEDDWPLAAEEEINHQRVCLRIPELPQHKLSEAIAILQEASKNKVNGCVGAVLDQIQDPRNFGAILRVAAFMGVQFIIYGKDRNAPITPHVVKTSAGGAFFVKLIPVVNISRALAEIKEAGGWIAGLALSPETMDIKKVPIDRPYIVVLGNEQRGIRPEIAKNCDYLAKIPGGVSVVESLNVSVAAGIVFNYFNAGNLGSENASPKV